MSRTRSIAVDWSGASQGAEKSMWLAEVTGYQVERLECERGRDEVAEFLIEERSRHPDMVVGLDFAFSLPQWFLDERGLASAIDLWDRVAVEGEAWLSTCEPPFWGRPGKQRPQLPEHFRRADAEVPPVAGIRPKSVFQIGGAGAVGTGSIRGMPILRRLRRAGFSIWPFNEPGLSTVIEIYPRVLTGAVAKSSPDARRRYLEDQFPLLDSEYRQLAESSEDAFDALVSAFMMDRHRAEFGALPPARDAQDLKEGRIWFPARQAQSLPQREVLPGALTAGTRRVIASPAAKLSASGVRLLEDFRDNLIVDRFDPQLAAMSGAKRSAMRSENSEDALTWNTFRALRRAAPGLWIPELSRRAFGGRALSADGEAQVQLWTRVEAPPSLRRDQKDEGASELDVLIETSDWVWAIEAKLYSEISLTTTNNAERDQVLRNIDVGSYHAGVRAFFFSLLVLDESRTSEGARRIGQYRDDHARLREKLPHRTDGLRNLGGVGLLTWADVRDVLRLVARDAGGDDAAVGAALALTWMAEHVQLEDG